MAKLDVSPTRMELLNLKEKVKTAKRGHKLLKDKQDGLMKTFMEVVKEARTTRKLVEEMLQKAFSAFIAASSMMHPEMLENALLYPSAKVTLTVDTKNVMSVNIPSFKPTFEGNIVNFGFAQTSSELERSLSIMQEAFLLMVQLAQIEKQAELLAIESEKTRRRVNALEHMLIPNLEETLKFIKMKLSEAERAAITGVMKIKEMVEAAEKEEAKKRYFH